MAITELGQNTPQGSAFYGLQDALGTINGQIPSTPEGDASLKNYYNTLAAAEAAKANIPAWAQQQQVSQMQAAGIPQETKYTANLNDMYKLFMADANLASQYMRPDFQQPGAKTIQPADTPTFGSVGAPSVPLMTLGSVNQPFAGFTDPGLAIQAAGVQGGSMTGMLKNIFDLINAQKTGIGETTTNAANMYAAKLNAITNMANIAKSMYDQGYIGGNGLLPSDTISAGMDTGDSNFMSLRDQYRKAFKATNNTAKRDAIAAGFKKATGKELWGVPITTQKDMDTVNNNARTLRDIKRAQEIINKHPEWSGGNPLKPGLGTIRGLVAQNLLENPVTRSAIEPDLFELNSIFTTMRTQAERGMIGGRLTGYILDRLGPAFAWLYDDPAQISKVLGGMTDNAVNDLKDVATMHSLTLDELPVWNEIKDYVPGASTRELSGGPGISGKTSSLDIGGYTILPE